MSDGDEALRQLTQRLPDGHDLLDDVLYHRISRARNVQEVNLLMKEVKRRCPDSDRALAFDEIDGMSLAGSDELQSAGTAGKRIKDEH
jgi:hypothetical protein